MKPIRIPSFTTPGTSYVVQPRGTTMDLVCECPAFRRNRPCKHTRVYRAVERALARCHNAGHGEVGICATCLAVVLVTSARKAKAETRAAVDNYKARLKRKVAR